MSVRRWQLAGGEPINAPAEVVVFAGDFGLAQPNFSVRRRTLSGGLSEGVQVVEIDNGLFRFSVLPTRGMGIWKGWLGDAEIGWQSSVAGPVHPQFVPMDAGGLGWLEGFDEWIVRCGLASNGPPEFDKRGVLQHSLHGRIANLPASHVTLEVDPERQEIRLSGVVQESRFLFTNLQLRTTIFTRFNEPGLTIHDEVTNRSARPAGMQLLYHINFGPPLLGPGSSLVAPAKTVVPRDPRAGEGIDHWSEYGAPEVGYAEQAYFFDLHANDHRTRVLLKNPQKALGASLAFDVRQLPCFVQWKNTAALADGYVTGLEPATNFPNPRSFEAEQGRVVPLAG